jgi:hypothetical protein
MPRRHRYSEPVHTKPKRAQSPVKHQDRNAITKYSQIVTTIVTIVPCSVVGLYSTMVVVLKTSALPENAEETRAFLAFTFLVNSDRDMNARSESFANPDRATRIWN